MLLVLDRSDLKRVLILSPCYNVANFIQEHINQLLNVVDKNDILLINDGSTDETGKIIEENKVQFISWKKQKGKASALRAGFKYALEKNFFAVITIDSDLQHDHRSILDLIEEYNKGKSDIIIAKRKFALGYMPATRILSNWLSSKIISFLVETRIHDSQCGLRYISKNFLTMDIRSNGFQFETEHLIRSCWAGAKISHIHTKTIYNKSKSAMKYVADTGKFVSLFFNLFEEKREYNDSKKQISEIKRTNDP